MAQSSGVENIGLERPFPSLPAQRLVLSLTRITPENSGKIRPKPDRESGFRRAIGGSGVCRMKIVSIC